MRRLWLSNVWQTCCCKLPWGPLHAHTNGFFMWGHSTVDWVIWTSAFSWKVFFFSSWDRAKIQRSNSWMCKNGTPGQNWVNWVFFVLLSLSNNNVVIWTFLSLSKGKQFLVTISDLLLGRVVAFLTLSVLCWNSIQICSVETRAKYVLLSRKMYNSTSGTS